MSATNLQGGLSDLMDTLNKARNNCTDPAQQAELQKIIRVHMLLWEEVLRQELDDSTADYQAALSAIDEAEQHARGAIADINKIAATLAKATKAAQAVDKMVKILPPLLNV